MSKMRTLSRKSFDEYRSLLEKIVTSSTKDFDKKVRRASVEFMNASNEATRSVYRDAIISEVYGRIDTNVALAQVRADDMFEAIIGEKPAEHSSFPYEAAEARVRSAAKHLFERGDIDAFIYALESFIEKEVNAAANIAMAENVEKTQ